VLSDLAIERYSRQIILPQVGGVGQQALLASSVFLIGTGTLAETFACYLTRSGIGELILPQRCAGDVDTDGDTRLRFLSQAIWRTAGLRLPDWGLGVALGASTTQVERLNRICVTWSIPLLWAQVSGSVGKIALYEGHRADRPCAQCQSIAASRGVRSNVMSFLTASMLGSWLTFEAIKVLLRTSPSLGGKVLCFDGGRTTFSEAAIDKNPACEICGQTAGGARK
jgi:adenylyltransferase/sulfurtransferase